MNKTIEEKYEQILNDRLNNLPIGLELVFDTCVHLFSFFLTFCSCREAIKIVMLLKVESELWIFFFFSKMEEYVYVNGRFMQATTGQSIPHIPLNVSPYQGHELPIVATPDSTVSSLLCATFQCSCRV